MIPFIVRRLIVAVGVLFVSTFLMYIMVASSGDPLANLRSRNPPPPKSTINALADQLHLNKPVVVRYFYWLGDALQGNLGKDINGNAVSSQLTARLGVTLRLVIVAMIVAVIFAVITGVVSAVKQYSVTDYTATFVGFVFISLPVFWFAGLLKDLAIRLNNAAGSQILTFSGEKTPDYNGGFFGNLSDRASHLILPTITLALLSYATWSRYLRASMLDVLNADYIRLARAKGVRWRRVMVRHGLRTALIPLTTQVALDTAAILGGAVLTENVFGWQGMGTMLVNGINAGDFNVILAWLTVAAIIVILFNLIADLLYGVLDPRIRHA